MGIRPRLMPDDTTKETLAETTDVIASDGSKAASEPASLKDILGKELGKQFPNDETALKAVKDTFKYVGEMPKLKGAMLALKQKFNVTDDNEAIRMLEEKVTPAAASQGTSSSPDELKALSDKVDRVTFYGENQQYKAHEKLIESLHASTGKSRSEIVADETYKEVLEKVQAADEAKNRKSVLQSNPRLGQAGTKLEEARTALKAGDEAGARRSAVGAVLEAYETN